LLVVGVERLIKRTADFIVLKVASQDEKEIVQRIEETTSDVVIVDGGFLKNRALQLFHLLNAVKGLRILMMQINSNQIQIYDKREIVLEPSADLTAFL
jgi:hypothetical protein